MNIVEVKIGKKLVVVTGVIGVQCPGGVLYLARYDGTQVGYSPGRYDEFTVIDCTDEEVLASDDKKLVEWFQGKLDAAAEAMKQPEA